MVSQVSFSPQNTRSDPGFHQSIGNSLSTKANHSFTQHSFDRNNSKTDYSQQNRAKLTLYLDKLLTYDVKKGLPVTEIATDKSVVQKKPDHSPALPESETGGGGEKNKLGEESENNNAESRMKEYINETWERYRKRYEHLGEKNPFASDPPSSEFLLKQKIGSGEENKTLNEEKGVNSKSDLKHKNTDESRNGDTRWRRISKESNYEEKPSVKKNSLQESKEQDRVEDPELNYESDQAIIESESSLPNEDEELSSDTNHDKTQENKSSAVSDVEDNVNEVSNEYDEINFYKGNNTRAKTSVPDIRALSINKQNYHPKRGSSPMVDSKINDLNRPNNIPTTFRRSLRAIDRNVPAKIPDPVRPLINPYALPNLVPPSVAAPQNPFYLLQPQNIPSNYFLAKPPFNQFNMFPYSFPWQSTPFPPAYLHPLLQHSIASSYFGSPILGQTPISFPPMVHGVPAAQGQGVPLQGVPIHTQVQNINSSSPLIQPPPSARGSQNIPHSYNNIEPGYGGGTYGSNVETPTVGTDEINLGNNLPTRENKLDTSNYQHPKFNSSRPGWQHTPFHHRYGGNREQNMAGKHYQNTTTYHNPYQNVDNSHGRQSTDTRDTSHFRQNSFDNLRPARPRMYNHQSSYQNQPYQHQNPDNNQHGIPNQDHRRTQLRSITDFPPEASRPARSRMYNHQSSYQNNPQPYQNTDNNQHGIPNQDHRRTQLRSIADFPPEPSSQHPQVPSSPYHSWYPDTPQFAFGNDPYQQ